MRAKKVAHAHGLRHETPAGLSVFYDLFPAEKAAEMEIRAQLLIGLELQLSQTQGHEDAVDVELVFPEWLAIAESEALV
jgi:hypothetical protein